MAAGSVDLFSPSSGLLTTLQGSTSDGSSGNLSPFAKTSFSAYTSGQTPYTTVQGNLKENQDSKVSSQGYIDYNIYRQTDDEPNRLNRSSAGLFEEWLFLGASGSSSLTDVITLPASLEVINALDVTTIWRVTELGASGVENLRFIAADRDEVGSELTGDGVSVCVQTSALILLLRFGCIIIGYQPEGAGLETCDPRCGGYSALLRCPDNPEGTTPVCAEEPLGFLTAVRSYYRKANPAINSTEAKCQSWYLTKTESAPDQIDDGPAFKSLPLDDLAEGCTIEADVLIVASGRLKIYWLEESQYANEDLIFDSTAKSTELDIPAGRHYVSLTVNNSSVYAHIDGLLVSVTSHDGWSITERNVVAVSGSLFPQITKNVVAPTEVLAARLYGVKLTSTPLYDESNYIPGTIG